MKDNSVTTVRFIIHAQYLQEVKLNSASQNNKLCADISVQKRILKIFRTDLLWKWKFVFHAFEVMIQLLFFGFKQHNQSSLSNE